MDTKIKNKIFKIKKVCKNCIENIQNILEIEKDKIGSKEEGELPEKIVTKLEAPKKK